MPVRIAVTGVGHWHAFEDAAYLTHLARLPDVSVVAIEDPDPASTARVADRLDPTLGTPTRWTDCGDMLAATRPDFVIALGRPATMAATAHRLLDARIPFLMEKPMGLDAAAVEGIADHAARTDGFAAVPLFQRYLPFAIRARAMIAEGRLGPISHLSIRNLRPGSDRYVRWGSAWMLDPAAGGGCLRNFGLHALDLFLHILGEEGTVVAAQVSSRALGEAVEDFACLQLRSASGVIGTIEVGNGFPHAGPIDAGRGDIAGDSEMALSGRDALLLAGKDGKLRVITAGGQEMLPGRPAEPPAFAMLRDTLANWRAGRPPVTDARDCARAMRLVDVAYALAG